MAGSSSNLHESPDQLTSLTRDLHRALVSLQEELEAVDWYRQRAEAADDESLRQVLLHNMGEEIEHATMLLEWIRRNEPRFNENFRTYLFTSRPIVEIEKADEERETGAPERPTPSANLTGFTIGSLKGN